MEPGGKWKQLKVKVNGMDVPKLFPSAGVILHRLQTAYQSDHDWQREREEGGEKQGRKLVREIGSEEEPNNQKSNV